MIEIIKSETFWNHDIDFQEKTLNDTISEFVDNAEDIVNVQFLTGNGSMRFIVYVKKQK